MRTQRRLHASPCRISAVIPATCLGLGKCEVGSRRPQASAHPHPPAPPSNYHKHPTPETPPTRCVPTRRGSGQLATYAKRYTTAPTTSCLALHSSSNLQSPACCCAALLCSARLSNLPRCTALLCSARQLQHSSSNLPRSPQMETPEIDATLSRETTGPPHSARVTHQPLLLFLQTSPACPCSQLGVRNTT